MLAGGYKEQQNHQNDARIQEIAKFATKEISSKEGKDLDLVKTKSVSTQVVAGKNYKLIMDLATKEQKVQPYEATVYEPLGEEKLQLTDHKAINKADAVVATEVTSERHTGAVLGGFEEISSEDPQAREAAEFATQQLSQQSNSLQPFLLKQVLDAQSQIGGTRSWRMKLEVSQGQQRGELYEVEVQQSFHNDYRLVKAQKINS